MQRRTTRQSLANTSVSVLGVGNGGVEELKDYLDDAIVAWALLRFQVGSGASTLRYKFAAIHFNGDDVPTVKRGRLNARSPEVLGLLGDAHATIEVKTKSELTLELLCERMLPVMDSTNTTGAASSSDALKQEYMEAVQACKQQSPKKDATAKGLLTAMDTPDLGITAQKALQAVGGMQGAFNWVLLEPTKLELHNAGFGGIEEMKKHLDVTKVLFGLVRFAFGQAEAQCGNAFVPAIVKHVFIHWVGAKVPVVRRGQWNAKQSEAEKQVKAYCVPIFRKEVHSEEEIVLQDMVKELQRLSLAGTTSSRDDSDQATISVQDYEDALLAEQQQLMASADSIGSAKDLPDTKTAVDTVRGVGGQWNWTLLGAASAPMQPGQSRPSVGGTVRKDTMEGAMAAAEQAMAKEGGAEQAAAEKAAAGKKEAEEKAAAEKAAAEAKAAADKAAADEASARAAAEKAATEKAAADKSSAEKAARKSAEKVAADIDQLFKVAADKSSAEKVAAGKLAADKAAAEKVAADKVASEKAAADKISEKAAFDAAVEKAANEKVAGALEEQRKSLKKEAAALEEQRKSLNSEAAALAAKQAAAANDLAVAAAAQASSQSPDARSPSAASKCPRCGSPPELCKCEEENESDDDDDDDDNNKVVFSPADPCPKGFIGAFDAVVGEGVTSLGWYSSSMPPDEVLVVQVDAGQWAGLVGVKEGDELMELQGKDVSDIDQAEFMTFMKQRPLSLSFFRAEGAVDKMLQRGTLPGQGGSRASTPLRPSVVNRLNSKEDVRQSVVARQQKEVFGGNTRSSQVARKQAADTAEGKQATRGMLHVRSGWTWKRRYFELHEGHLRWWRSTEAYESKPQVDPDCDLCLVGVEARWVVHGLSGTRFELIWAPLFTKKDDPVPEDAERKSFFSRTKSSIKAPEEVTIDNVGGEKAEKYSRVEKYLFAADDIKEATEWARALWHHTSYLDMITYWPMPLEGRQGDVTFYGISYPAGAGAAASPS